MAEAWARGTALRYQSFGGGAMRFIGMLLGSIFIISWPTCRRNEAAPSGRRSLVKQSMITTVEHMNSHTGLSLTQFLGRAYVLSDQIKTLRVRQNPFFWERNLAL